MSRKNLILIFLIFVFLYICFDLSPLLQKESLKDISYSDIRYSIGPALSGAAAFLGYRAEIKKEKINSENNSVESFKKE